jgi:hypothetical protein
MKRWWRTVLALVVSCGSGNDEGPSDTSAEGVCQYYAEKNCAADERCHPAFKAAWSDGATCQERVRLGCISRLTASGVNDTSSRIVACANALAVLSCDKFMDYAEQWPETCFPPPGQLADDAPCIVFGQCQSGFCNIRSSSACGVCKSWSRAGGTCASNFDCFNFLPCVGGICTPFSRTGETCDNMERQCATGLVCRDVDAMNVGTCGAPTPLGGTCDFQNDLCDIWQGVTCQFGSMVCSRLPPPPAVGEQCSDGGNCGALAHCTIDNVCKAKPREGQPCIAGQVDCMTPARCLAGVCKIRDAAVCK